MKRVSIPLGCLLTFLLSTCGGPPKETVKRYTIQQFMDITQINGGSFSPDDSTIILNSKESGIFNIQSIDIKTGARKPLTSSTDNAINGLSYFPGDKRIVYTSDKGGNEINHLFVLNPDGSTVDLIQDSTAKATFMGWSYNRTMMYYVSNSRDKKFFDLYRAQIPTGENPVYASTSVYKNEKGLNPNAVSNDDRYIALSESITTNNSNMYLLDTQTGKAKLLSAPRG